MLYSQHEQRKRTTGLLRYYESTDEAGRLERPESQLEKLRTRDILSRFLPKAPSVILDVGGGPAVHSVWMANLGYQVHLVDLVPVHIEQARQISATSPCQLAGAQVGDACDLDFPNDSIDAVVSLGPLYHIKDREGRAEALAEAWRVLQANGMLIAGGLSRYTYATKALIRGAVRERDVATMILENVISGTHTPLSGFDGIAEAYFHRPAELRDEVTQAGFVDARLLAVEGPARLLPRFAEQWHDEALRRWLLELIGTVECEESIMGLSGHFCVIARKAG